MAVKSHSTSPSKSYVLTAEALVQTIQIMWKLVPYVTDRVQLFESNKSLLAIINNSKPHAINAEEEVKPWLRNATCARAQRLFSELMRCRSLSKRASITDRLLNSKVVVTSTSIKVLPISSLKSLNSLMQSSLVGTRVYISPCASLWRKHFSDSKRRLST